MLPQQLPLQDLLQQTTTGEPVARPKRQSRSRKPTSHQAPITQQSLLRAEVEKPQLAAPTQDSKELGLSRLRDRPTGLRSPSSREPTDLIALPRLKYDYSTDPNYDPLKICYQRGSNIKTGGLDHFLCGGDCGYVVDRIWQQQQEKLEAERRLRRQKETPQSATQTKQIDSNIDTEAVGLFASEMGGES